MTNPRTVLIIDDCTADRKVYRRYLLQDPHLSYQILEADCAEDGLAICQQTPCDALLLDICLPGMNGLEFLDELKYRNYYIPQGIIVLTGHSEEDIVVQVMKRGVKDYLVKQHLKSDVLQLTVRNIIAKSNLEIQLLKTQERQRLIATTALRIRQSLNLETILHTAVTEIQQLLQCDHVAVYRLDSSEKGQIVAEVTPSICNLGPRNTDLEVFSPPKTPQQDSFKGKDDSKIQIISYCLKPDHALNHQDNLFTPITLNNNGQGESSPKIWGYLLVNQCSRQRHWQPDEVEMLEEVAVQLAIAIQQSELLSITQSALEKEKQLNAFKSQIVATVSHEYRTPLAAILAAASTLREHSHKLPSAKQEKFLRMIEDKARQMSKLVDNLLSVNQIELDKTRFKPLPIDLIPFFSDLIEEQRQMADPFHSLQFKVTGQFASFWGDQGMLRLILDNLISNAIKYSPNGGQIDVKLSGNSQEITLSVQDQGIGIPREDQPLLFQSFSRAKNVDTIPGTGLGLVIVKACVELHQGTISLKSQVSKGTKITVKIPKNAYLCSYKPIL